MMTIFEALRIDGTETYHLANYFVFRAGEGRTSIEEIREIFAGEDSQITRLHNDEWPIEMVLIEKVFATRCEFVGGLVSSISKGTSVEELVCSVCMYDGVFSGDGDLFSPDNPSQIYGVWIPGGEINIAMNDDLRSSKAWQAIVTEAHDRIAGCHHDHPRSGR
ncbi:MAG: hypothetical protein JWO82_1151 [Akkermansiaceae bacterium]|nr:hypothetical protein [Akkermansiaceae bacterium]